MSNGKAGAAPSSTAAPTANAWANPLRPKPNVAAGPPPGMGGGKGKNNSGSNGAAGGGVGHQNALRERFISLSLTMVGQKVVVTQTNGAVFEGIFHTFSPFNSLPGDIKNKFVIKACRVIKPPSDEGGSKTKQAVDQSTVIIGVDKVACLTVKSMRIDTATSGTNGSSQKRSTDGFRTDTEISGPKGGRSRDLVAAGSAWTTGGGGGPGPGPGGGGSGNSRADALMGGLEDKDKGRGGRKGFGTANPASAGLQGNIGQWDQFRANEELFNVKSNFDESVYTTELDKSQIDKKKIAEAERMAKEIEGTTTGNMHMKEERNQKLADDYDDEARYSSVITSDKVAVPVAEKGEKKEKAKNDNSKSAAPKKMNYAAAAAKADPVKKSGPPGFSSGKDDEKEPGAKSQSKEEDVKAESEKESVKDKPTESEAAKPSEAKEPKEEAKKEKPAKSEAPEPKQKQKAKPTEEKKAATEPAKAKKAEAAPTPAPAAKETAGPAVQEKAAPAEKAEPKAPSKLNANAKVFSLKATAKAFVPGGGHAPAPAPPAPEGHFVDPNAAAMHGQVASHMPGPHYMPQIVHQPGMMPMMNPQQFPGGVRYAAAGYGMDQSQQQQHMAQQMQAQPQHAPPAHGSGAPSPGPTSTDENAQAPQQEGGEAAPAAPAAPMPQQPQQPGQPPQQQQQQVQVPYGVPPAPYYGGQMMHARGPGGPHPAYHPQFVGGPPQMVGQAGGPYRQMYPMPPGGMAPNVHVRGPQPYYTAGPVPVPYPPNQYVNHNMMDDDPGFRGGQGRGRGRGGGRGRGRRGGRGGRNYNNYHQHGGRGHQGQNQNGPSGPSENWSSGPDNSNTQADGGGGGMPGPSGANQSGKPGDKSGKQ